jgi:hypothetical protein
MEFQEKAKIRIQHWLAHNEGHLSDYEEFAGQMETAGFKTSARHIREMIAWAAKSNNSMREALNSLSAMLE